MTAVLQMAVQARNAARMRVHDKCLAAAWCTVTTHSPPFRKDTEGRLALNLLSTRCVGHTMTRYTAVQTDAMAMEAMDSWAKPLVYAVCTDTRAWGCERHMPHRLKDQHRNSSTQAKALTKQCNTNPQQMQQHSSIGSHYQCLATGARPARLAAA